MNYQEYMCEVRTAAAVDMTRKARSRPVACPELPRAAAVPGPGGER